VGQKEVKLRAGGHGILAEGVLVAQVVRDQRGHGHPTLLRLQQFWLKGGRTGAAALRQFGVLGGGRRQAGHAERVGWGRARGAVDTN